MRGLYHSRAPGRADILNAEIELQYAMTPYSGPQKSGRTSRVHALLNSRPQNQPVENETLITWSGLPALDELAISRSAGYDDRDAVRNLAAEAATRSPA